MNRYVTVWLRNYSVIISWFDGLILGNFTLRKEKGSDCWNSSGGSVVKVYNTDSAQLISCKGYWSMNCKKLTLIHVLVVCK